MNKRSYLVFDLGASNGRALTARFDGAAFSMQVCHRFDNRPVHMGGLFFWDFLRLLSEVKIGLQAAVSSAGRIDAVGIDTWGCDFGLLDRNGELLSNPLNYRNRRRHERRDELYRIIPADELFFLSGGDLNTIMGVYELYAMKAENSVALEQAHRFLMIPDLMNYVLTGEDRNEITDATMSLMCDQTNRSWQPEIARKLGLDASIFGEIISPGEKIGRLSAGVREELDLPAIDLYAVASHDTASAVAGIPVHDPTKNWAFISMGTWCIGGVETMKPVINRQTYESGYGNTAGVEGRNILMKLITGLWIIQQCRARWVRDFEREVTWDEIVDQCREAGPVDALFDVDYPDFGSPQSNMPEVIREYCRKTSQTVPESMGQVARCFYQNLALKFRYNLQVLETLIEQPIQLLHLVGGGTQNELLCQWTADATGILVVAGPIETTSIGNLLMQLKGTGEISTIEEGREISRCCAEVRFHEPGGRTWWDEQYERYSRIMRTG